MPAETQSANVDLVFTPDERCLRHIRVSLVGFVMVLVENRDLASRVGMAAAELVESAIKHSIAGHPVKVRIRIRHEASGDLVRLETESEVPEAQVAQLNEEFGALQQGTGVEAYLRMLSQKGGPDAGASMGLVRIRYEGQMELRHAFAGRVLTVIAEGQGLSKPAAPPEPSLKPRGS